MRRFAEAFEALDTTTSTLLKTQALRSYLRDSAPADAAWATWILSGRRLKRLIGPALLRRWLTEACALPEWLVDETYASVGDLAETIALLMETNDGPRTASSLSLSDWIEQRLLPLRGMDETTQHEQVLSWWQTLPARECFLVNKLLTGGLRVGVSELLVTRAIAEQFELPRSQVARALLGDWHPSAGFWTRLVTAGALAHDASQPYPFCLASPLEGSPVQLGERDDFVVEWKWDGIRSQLINREGQVYLWSRGAELITDRFPEVTSAARTLPAGTVLDGELLAWSDERVATFALLQQRIGRKKPGAAILRSAPVRFLAYDLLEQGGTDIRSLPLQERRARLETLLADSPDAIGLSPQVQEADWTSLQALRSESRSRGVEGFMLKNRALPYGSGRQRGNWWKWKIEPWTFEGVLLYAQPAHGRRSGLYTDYTFGVWQDGKLLPIAKAYSGLSNAQILVVDRWIRANTVERFGPVRSVKAELVFELAFEGIAASPRHKAGIALRFPRIVRQRSDKPAAEADTLQTLRDLLQTHVASH